MAEPLEDLFEAGEVLFPSGGEDDDIIEVKEAGFPVEHSQDSIHEARQGGRSVAEAKRYLIKLEKLAAAGTEGSLLLILLLYGDLPIPAFQVEGGEPGSTMQGIGEVFDAGNGVGVFDCSCIELPEVNTEPETTVFLFHHVTQPLYESRMNWVHDPAPPASRRPIVDFDDTPASAITSASPGAAFAPPQPKKSRRRRRRWNRRSPNQNSAHRSAAPVTPDERWANENSASQRATRPKSAANDLPKMMSFFL